MAAALSAVFLSQAQDAPLCEPATAQLVGVWDEPTRQAVRHAITTAAAPTGSPTWGASRCGC